MGCDTEGLPAASRTGCVWVDPVRGVLWRVGAAICLFGWTLSPIELLGIFVGPFLIGMWLTLRDRAMLGDTGSNVAGAIVGVWLLTELGETGRLIALVVVLGITILGEFRSISGIIEKIPPLRFVDSLGRVK